MNRPKAAEIMNYQRDGYTRFDSNGGGSPNYYPNSFGGPEPDIQASEHVFKVEGNIARQPYSHLNDDFGQPGNLFRKVMTDKDRDHLIRNIVSDLKNAHKEIQIRQTKLFHKVDTEYGRRVAEGLILEL